MNKKGGAMLLNRFGGVVCVALSLCCLVVPVSSADASDLKIRSGSYGAEKDIFNVSIDASADRRIDTKSRLGSSSYDKGPSANSYKIDDRGSLQGLMSNRRSDTRI